MPGGVGGVSGLVINVVDVTLLPPPHCTGTESCLLKLPQSEHWKQRNWADAKIKINY